MSPPNFYCVCRAPAKIFSHSSKVQFVAFCFTLGDGSGAGSLDPVLIEEEGWEVEDVEKKGRMEKSLKVENAWHQLNLFQLDMF